MYIYNISFMSFLYKLLVVRALSLMAMVINEVVLCCTQTKRSVFRDELEIKEKKEIKKILGGRYFWTRLSSWK